MRKDLVTKFMASMVLAVSIFAVLLDGAHDKLNIHHQLVYQVLGDIRTVKINRMWTPYE